MFICCCCDVQLMDELNRDDTASGQKQKGDFHLDPSWVCLVLGGPCLLLTTIIITACDKTVYQFHWCCKKFWIFFLSDWERTSLASSIQYFKQSFLDPLARTNKVSVLYPNFLECSWMVHALSWTLSLYMGSKLNVVARPNWRAVIERNCRRWRQDPRLIGETDRVYGGDAPKRRRRSVFRGFHCNTPSCSL